MFALMAAVGTGLAASSSMDFTGADYRQHPIGTIVGTLLPSVIGGVIAYFIVPRIFPNFGLNVTAARLCRKELLAVLAALAVSIGAGWFTISAIQSKHNDFISQFDPDVVGEMKVSTSMERNPFDDIIANYDRDTRMECYKAAQANYNAAQRVIDASAVGSASLNGGAILIGRRRLLNDYCTVMANCRFDERSHAQDHTQAFFRCRHLAEKDMLSD